MNGLRSPTRRAQRQSCSSRSLSTQADERRLESISVVHVAGPYPMTGERHRGRRYFFQLADGRSPPKTGIKILSRPPVAGRSPSFGGAVSELCGKRLAPFSGGRSAILLRRRTALRKIRTNIKTM